MANGDKHSQANTIWLIIFCDITTNLMLFFLMLFAMTRMSAEDRQLAEAGIKSAISSKADREKAFEEKKQKIAKEEAAIESMSAGIASKTQAGAVDMSVDEKSIKIVLKLPVFFTSGSADLATEAKTSLDAITAPLKEFPNDIVIEGHTDDVPISGGKHSSNWELSIARAVSVIDFFVARGLNPAQFVAGGYGEYHPVHPNDTVEHRSQNRRIEITIIRQPKV